MMHSESHKRLRPILNIAQASFAPYGQVLEFSEGFNGFFEVIVREALEPWRMAVYAPPRTCDFLENHPGSRESFEPVRGTSLLLVAINATPSEFEVFLLDKPVCLHKGVWHNSIALSADVMLRVTENLEVSSEFFKLEREIEVGALLR